MIILCQVFDSEVLEALKDAGVDVVKGGPSMTSHHQALDVSMSFREVKRGMRTVPKAEYHGNDSLVANLESYMTAFFAQFPSCRVASGYKTKIFAGIQRLVYVLRGKWFTSTQIIEGFLNCGQHQPHTNPGEGSLTINWDRIMAGTLVEMSDCEKQLLLEKRDVVVAEFLAHGRVTNEFLDAEGIPDTEGAENRDSLTICRQDAQCITHADSSHRIITLRQAMALQANPGYKELQKRSAAAKKRLLTGMKSKIKATSAKARTDLEKARRAGLSKEQKKAEDAEKKALAKAKVEAKAAQKKEQEEKDKDFFTGGELEQLLLEARLAVDVDMNVDDDDDDDDDNDVAEGA